MNRRAYYAAYRRAFGRIRSQTVVDGSEALLDRLQAAALELEQQAYILATVYHETAHSFQPVREKGQGRGRPYGEPVLLYQGQRRTYYGRGWPQLTWLLNYVQASIALGRDYVSNPDLLLTYEHSGDVLLWGMTTGAFTGRKLSDFVGGGQCDYVDARRVVNGLDRAELIAGYAERFQAALEAALR